MTATTAARKALEIEARPPHKLLALAEGRAVFELASFYATRHLLGMLPKGDGHPVLVLPGFMASDSSTAPMRRLLKDLGYDAYGWKLGRNVRVDLARVHEMERLLLDIHAKTGRKVSIVGWSLGGVFARELAKLHPEAVRQVISLGSPIHDDRRHTNASKLFEWLNGKEPEVTKKGHFTGLHQAPPVPTTSVLTKTDGVVHWRGSVQQADHAQCENVEVHASHCGLGVNPSVMVVLADRLKQPEGEWQPFKPGLTNRWMFPKTRLH
ncbi:esterase/lipase family protein [Novosphingobium sp. B 225]|uniref:esterase/lipase family protein n=1 Tax=Novosphingobium sp. B 225 TaxID=1961849 RepID=UPI000B4B0D5A|nr:alpha/beta hydrolase [Novosphingobium sp. B 225]